MARLKADNLVSGLGTGMSILDVLIKEIQQAGGSPSDLAFLPRPVFKANLTKIAQVIAECEWRFPVSKIKELAEQEYRQSNYIEGDAFIGHAQHRVWGNALFRLGIPYTAFSDMPYRNPEYAMPNIPDSVREWLHGKEVTYPLLADKWVVTDWVVKDPETLIAGDIIKADRLVSLILAEQRYFDFES
jgi:hypothetical protein